MKIPKINYQEGDSLESIFNKNKDFVYNRIFNSIKFGVINNLKAVVIFELGNTKTFVDLLKENWENSLQNCMYYFTEIEDYEKCIECKELIQQIKKLI